MGDQTTRSQAIEQLQQLGLRTYEANCFVALSILGDSTAREISDVVDVPRTRVYDAVRSLQTDGLVEIQHTSPKRFRAVPLEEAIDILRQRYVQLIDDLEASLHDLSQTQSSTDDKHSVWSLSGSDGITARMQSLIKEADEELLCHLGADRDYSDQLFEQLQTTSVDQLALLVDPDSDLAIADLQHQLPEAFIYPTSFPWTANQSDPALIARMLVADRNAALISSLDHSHTPPTEHAVFAEGPTNGLVVTLRQLLSSNLDTNDHQ